MASGLIKCTPVNQKREKKMRAFNIDRVRIFLTILVVFHHTAIAFGASGGWYYESQTQTSGMTQLLLSAQMAIDQSYFMSLFFFISALFMPTSYDRKGFGQFMKDRWLRLGLPLIIYILLIHPSVVYLIHISRGLTDANWFQFTYVMITEHLAPGPMWFVLALLVMESCYALYRKFFKVRLFTRLSDQLPSTKSIIIFMAATGIIAFLLRLKWPTGWDFFNMQWGFFSLYVAMYFVGIIACRKHWLEKISLQKAEPWIILAMLNIPVLLFVVSYNADNMDAFSGGLNILAAFYAFWEPIMCVGISYFLLSFTKRFFNRPNTVVSALSGDSYLAYIIHPAAVVTFTLLFESLLIAPIAKLFLVFAASTISMFAISHILRLIPGIKKVV